MHPALSIILPTYNRATFLPQAFEAICAQTFADWELVVVDDGSSDDTESVVRRLTVGIEQPVRYVRQNNRGAYGARNSGLDLATGNFVAFYDSDDQWLPNHLQDCVAAMEAHPKVDWVFSACRRVEHGTGRILRESTFYNQDGEPWPFLRLATETDGPLRILNDPQAMECMLKGGFNCGLQTSVIRRRVFENYRFQTRFRNEAEDQMVVIYAMSKGFRMAYFDSVHVVYNVHSDNSSATTSQGAEKRATIIAAEARGYEELSDRGIPLSPVEQHAVRKRLLQLYFWQMGYFLYWQNDKRRDALAMYRRGLQHWPWSLKCWKTYLLASVRTLGSGDRSTRIGA